MSSSVKFDPLKAEALFAQLPGYVVEKTGLPLWECASCRPDAVSKQKLLPSEAPNRALREQGKKARSKKEQCTMAEREKPRQKQNTGQDRDRIKQDKDLIGTGDYAHPPGNDLGTDQYTSSGSEHVAGSTQYPPKPRARKGIERLEERETDEEGGYSPAD